MSPRQYGRPVKPACYHSNCPAEFCEFTDSELTPTDEQAPADSPSVDWYRVSQHAMAALLGIVIAVFLMGSLAVLVTALDIR